jgi:Skp family chaperone for outer membrane proteins
MKKTGTYLIVSVVLTAGLFVLKDTLAQPAVPAAPAPAPVPATAIAVCDIVEIFNSYQKAKDLSADVAKTRVGLEAQSKRRTQLVEDLQKELGSLNKASAQYEKRVDLIQKTMIDNRAWLDTELGRNVRQGYRLTQEMYKEIQAAVAQTARDLGCQLVLQRNRNEPHSANTRELLSRIATRKVVYAANQADITEIVLSRLNLAYRQRKP